MKKRWNIIKKELNIKKEYIKSIKRVPNEKMIIIYVVDEENTTLTIIFDVANKTYSLNVVYANGIEYTTKVQSVHEDYEFTIIK